MANIVVLSVREIVGSPNCVDTNDGHAVLKKIAAHLSQKEAVEISFKGVDRVTTAFLNAAIGQLYNEFDEDEIRQGIHFTEFTPTVGAAVGKVIARAKEYFKNSALIDEITKDVLDS